MITYVDLGAHDGTKAVEYAGRVPMRAAYLFEPNPNIIPAIIPHVPTEIIRAAAWDGDGEAPLYIGQIWHGQGSTLLREKTTGALDLANPIRVRTIDFARWLLEHRELPDIELKFNIEGAEYRVLDHLCQQHVLDQVDVRAIHWSHHAKKIGLDPTQMAAHVTQALTGFCVLEASPFGGGFITYRRSALSW